MARYGARKDSLTGLLNQNGFEKNVSKFKADRSRANSSAYCYCYLDIHNMKAFNLTYGKKIGDELILLLCEKLIQVFPNDTIGRLDDDHFIVYTCAQDLNSKLEKIREYCKSSERRLPFEFHVGIYRDNRNAKPEYAIECARLALQSIKSDYRQFVKYYSDAMSDEYLNRIYILNHIDRAIEEHWIRVFYQPIIRTATGKACGLEALARWVDPERGLITPGQFIPIFEQVHLNAKLDLYIVEEVCKEMKVSHEQGFQIMTTSVNLSPEDFETEDMPSAICEIADQYGIPHEKIVIEITESAFIKQPKRLQDAIKKFHAHGFKVWLDDFGSGFSSLNVLKSYPFDVIKFDIEFIRDLDPQGAGAVIIKNMIQMARELGIHTLAEGIESGVQFNFLKLYGCECLQGFLFEKPRPLSYYFGTGKSEVTDFTEAEEETKYYDVICGVDHKKPYFGALPTAVENIVNEGPWAVLEVTEDRIVFVKSNQRYEEYLFRNHILTNEDIEQSTGQSWICHRSNALIDAVKESLSKGNWVAVVDRINENQEIKGYLYAMEQNPVTGAHGVLLAVQEE